MTREDWMETLARIVADQPVDLDAALPRRPAARMGRARQAGPRPELPPPSERIWSRPETERACIGIRVTRERDDLTEIAMHLASIAIERAVYPVILSSVAASGFERFGFRVERIPAASGAERDRIEAELMRFWTIGLIIDADDITGLG